MMIGLQHECAHSVCYRQLYLLTLDGSDDALDRVHIAGASGAKRLIRGGKDCNNGFHK